MVCLRETNAPRVGSSDVTDPLCIFVNARLAGPSGGAFFVAHRNTLHTAGNAIDPVPEEDGMMNRLVTRRRPNPTRSMHRCS